MKTVAIAIFPGVQALDVAGPLDVFMEANSFIAPQDAYAITVVGADRTAVRASNGMKLTPDVGFDEAADRYDLLLVAGGPDLPTASCDPRLAGSAVARLDDGDETVRDAARWALDRLSASAV